MKRLNFALFSLLFPLISYAQGVVFSPDRPGMATGPGIMQTGKVMWETGFEGVHENGDWAIAMPTTMFRVGLSEFAEVRLQYDGVLGNADNEWKYSVAPLTLGTKLHLLNGGGWVPEISFMADLSIPCTKSLCDEMKVAPSLYLLFQNDVCDWFNVCYNIGAEWNGVDAKPDTFLAVCLGFSPSDKVGLFVENFNYIGTSYNLDAGINFMIAPKVQLDFYAGLNMTKPKAMTVIGGGIAWLIN